MIVGFAFIRKNRELFLGRKIRAHYKNAPYFVKSRELNLGKSALDGFEPAADRMAVRRVVY